MIFKKDNNENKDNKTEEQEIILKMPTGNTLLLMAR
jgi:hypothetical protein